MRKRAVTMTKKQKKTLIRISIGAVFYILAIVFPTDRLDWEIMKNCSVWG